jgi:hypothetical protein
MEFKIYHRVYKRQLDSILNHIKQDYTPQYYLRFIWILSSNQWSSHDSDR